MDQRKVQLLTLGTGFDFELSAKENVYLNGAIIGYSKAFIDEHYQEIVDFAELEGFMGRKSKEFFFRYGFQAGLFHRNGGRCGRNFDFG